MDKTKVGLLGMFEVALRLVKQGKIITVHGGSCAFDLSDADGNRYEVKTATANMKGDKQHGDYRGWVFASCSQVIFDDRQIGDYSDDCEVGGYIVYMTPSEVFQRWGSVYEDKEQIS